MSKYYKVKNTTNICLNPNFNCIKSSSLTFTRTSGGTGYLVSPNIVVTPAGGDSGFGAVVTGTFGSGGIASITTVSAGKGYNKLPTISYTGIINYSAFAGGSGYRLPPLITASGGSGYGFVGSTLLTPTTVNGFIIDNGGSGYTNGSAITFNNTGTNGTGVTATITTTAGVITAITITGAGSGYTAGAPTITSIAGTGSGAVIRFLLAPVAVASIVIANPGFNYPASGTTFTITNRPNGAGTGATATPTITPTTAPVITVAFDRTFAYTWDKLPTITINDMGRLKLKSIIATTTVANTPYTFRLHDMQYTSKDFYNSDYGDPTIAQFVSSTTSYNSLTESPFSLILPPQNINYISLYVDDSITTKDTGIPFAMSFVIILEIEEFDPITTEINDVYRESASRLRLNY